ncbi:segregation and condensation protein A [Elusimicrobiota bacterium]
MSNGTLKEAKDAWLVDIDSFEGPFDLLLHLVRKNDLDIYEIPIAEITAEYLKYLEVLETHNLDNVGDFLVMASILMYIKARTLLPSEETAEEGIEMDADKMKQDLIERLLEYKKFKESAQILRDKERLYEGVVGLNQYPLNELGEKVDATLYDVIDAFRGLIEKARKDVKDILTEEFTVEDKIRFVMTKVEKNDTITLKELVGEKSSVLELVVTLLALLELVRTHQIKVIQDVLFGEITISIYEQQN